MLNTPYFEQDETFLPITMQQFQDLTNELLTTFNYIMAPQALDGNYMAQIVHGVIHSIDRKQAIVKKSELLDGCINMVSKHVTFHAVQEIEARLKAEKTQTESPPTDNVIPLDQENT